MPEFIDAAEQARLLEVLRALPFDEVVMRGQVARRRVIHFGWRYGYESWRIEPGPPLPVDLHPLRAKAAALVGVADEALAEALITAYPAGAGIGWHRDAPQFGDVIGISLLGACRMRFRKGAAGARQTRVIELAPRSVYVLAGEARWAWQHTIPATKTERYSVTFRTVRTGRKSSRSRSPATRRG